MRRILLLVVGVLALALAVPGAASARGHHHRHHHKAHHARIKHIGAKGANASDPSTPATGDAGTVASFTDGVLTITLADGSTVSGKVTDRTEIHCVTAVTPPPTPTATIAHDGGGDWANGDQGDDSQGGNDQGDGEDHHCQGPSACSVTDLVPGAIVHEAELRIGAGGSEFKQITLTK